MNRDPPIELFTPVSPGIARLRRWMPGLFAPEDGQGSWGARIVRSALVAPSTQLTFVNFDQQAFLFDVFHTSRAARIGHAVGMSGVNLFAMAAAIALLGPAAGVTAAGLLLVWYAVVARSAGLPAWWFATVPLVAALLAGAFGVLSLAGPHGAMVGGLGVLASGIVISLSHAMEPLYPPRAGHPSRWMPIGEFVRGASAEERRPGRVVARIARVCLYPLGLGVANEIWASPRLLPYNLLRLMLGWGYAPELRERLDDWAQRALDSGQPALDFVGIGGGSFLRQ